MADRESPCGFPGFEALVETLPKVIELGTVELTRYLRNRELSWLNSDPAIVATLERIGRSFTTIRFDTGWSVAEALHVIGCQQRSGTLNSDHLAVALRHIRRLATGVADLCVLVEDPVVVDRAFRSPPGDPTGPLRTMASDSWIDMYLDARAFASDFLFDSGPPIRVNESVRRSVLAIRQRRAS